VTWHADARVLAAYAGGDPRIDDAQAFSLEAHLLECEACRAGVGAVIDTERLAASWWTLDAAIDAPRPGPVESVLRRLGVRQHLARLVAATPALRLSWLAAVALALAFAVLAAYGGQGDRAKLVFLLVAPLLPMVGVAAAYWPGLDPASEVALVSPYGGFRLLLVRTVAVMAATTGLAAVAALALPGLGTVAAAWVVPALALAAVSLALATLLRPLTATFLVAAVWVVGVLASEMAAAGSTRAFFRAGPIESGIFHAGGQVMLLAVTIAAVAVVAMRRNVFDMRRTA
jgi:hypothetical protein